jgi:hypothetical protein
MSGAVESNNKYFKVSVYLHFKIVPKCMQRLENEAQGRYKRYTKQLLFQKRPKLVMHLLLFHRPGAAWVFWEALGTPDGSRPMKKERPASEIWQFWAKLGFILEPLFFELGPLGSKMAAR